MKVFAVSLLALLVIVLIFLALVGPAFSRVETVEVRTIEQSGGLPEGEQVPPDGGGQTSALEQKVSDLEAQVSELQSNPNFPGGPAGQAAGAGSAASVAILFGAFCALWAQNTGRSPWLWFFLGLFGNVIAVLALLVRNSDDKTAA